MHFNFILKCLFLYLLASFTCAAESKVVLVESNNCHINLFELYKSFRVDVLADNVNVDKVFEHLSSKKSDWEDPVAVVNAARKLESDVMSVQSYHYSCDAEKGYLFLKISSFGTADNMANAVFKKTNGRYKISSVTLSNASPEYTKSIGVFTLN